MAVPSKIVEVVTGAESGQENIGEGDALKVRIRANDPNSSIVHIDVIKRSFESLLKGVKK